MKYRLTILLPVIIISIVSISGSEPVRMPASVEKAIEMLDEYLERKNEFMRLRTDSIDSMKMRLATASPQESLDLYNRLGYSYRLINTDSALFYYGRGIETAERAGDTLRRIEFVLHTASLLPVNAIIRESVDMYEEIDPSTLPPKMRRDYFEAGNRLYLYAESFYSVDSLRQKYRRMASVATDSLLKYETAGTARYIFYNAQAAHNRGDLPPARAGMKKVMGMLPANDNLYARAAAELAALTNESSGYTSDEHLYYLIMAAIGDIAAGTRETTALQSVGAELYKAGDLTRAYRYLSESQDNALLSGARIRTLQVAEVLPIIARTHKKMADDAHNRLLMMVWLLALAAISLGAFTVVTLLQRRKMHTYEQRLKQNLAAKDDYIGRILSLCSIYIERLEDFNRMAGRKIKAGQVGELLEMIESGKMLQEQTRKFHELFDAAFNKVYPNFADEVNKLLLPDKQLSLTEDGRYTPELRLLALIRTGITDSSRLARFLGLSLNTVYTYRNKLKNRAANRSSFEEDIMKIGTISYI